MKMNKHYSSTADSRYNELSVDNHVPSRFTMESEYLKAYSLYFTKYIQAYQTEGINVSAIHPQNEISASQVFPSCLWNAKELNVFIGEYLGPELGTQNIDAELWLGTINDPSFTKMDSILSNTESVKYIKGVGYQWAGKEAIGETHRKYPNLKLMQSENECGNGSNDWAATQIPGAFVNIILPMVQIHIYILEHDVGKKWNERLGLEAERNDFNR